MIVKGKGPFRVKLIRGKLETVIFEHTTHNGAQRRAWALGDLHSARVDYTHAERGGGDIHFTVDASHYYGK